MTHFSFLVIGERERRLLHMVPGSPEASHPAPETTEAPKEARQLHINPDNPVDMQTQVLDASTRRGTQAVTAEFRRRDQVAASLQRQFDGMKTSGTFDAYPSRVQEWMAQTNASLNGRYTVGLMNGEVRLYPTGSVPTETRSEGLPPNPPMAPNRPSPAAPNTPESTPPATPEKGAPAPKAATDAPDASNEPFDPVKGEGAPEGEKPAAGLDGEIPKEDQENLKKLAEKMLEGQDPTKMSEKQKDMLVGRVQMNTGVGVVEKGNKFEVVAPKTNMERLMNVIAGVMLFVKAIFPNKDASKNEGTPESGDTYDKAGAKERVSAKLKDGKTLPMILEGMLQESNGRADRLATINTDLARAKTPEDRARLNKELSVIDDELKLTREDITYIGNMQRVSAKVDEDWSHTSKMWELGEGILKPEGDNPQYERAMAAIKEICVTPQPDSLSISIALPSAIVEAGAGKLQATVSMDPEQAWEYLQQVKAAIGTLPVIPKAPTTAQSAFMGSVGLKQAQ